MVGAIPEELRAAIQREARRELWRRREVWPLLEAYLDRDQLEDIRSFFGTADPEKGQLPKDSWYDEISRQRGKSWKWCVLSVVWCHCHPNQFIKYAAQLGKSVRRIIWPTIRQLVKDMPADAQGEGSTPEDRERNSGVREDKTDHTWRFPNGSEILAAGVNLDHEDDLRGSKAHIFIKDECGFYTNFPKVQDVANPQLMTTGGVSVYATTPPESPGHPVRVIREALKAIGRYVHRTIYSHPRYSPEFIEEYLAGQARERGLTLEQFKATTYYRREFLCLWVAEESRAVVPEWNTPAGPEWPEGTTWGDVHTRELPRPDFYDAYDFLDIGFTRDPSAWLGGYWDWANARLVIEAETPPLYRTRSDALAKEINAHRFALWPVTGPRPSREAKKSTWEQDGGGAYWVPHLSVGDGSGNGAEKLQELAAEGLNFVHADKADLEARVNALRTLVAQGKLYVHPRCVNLRKQLAMGLWASAKQRVDFERTEEGHLDHLAALVDGLGHVDRQRRPVPFDFGVDMHNTVHAGGTIARDSLAVLNNALGEIQWE